MVLFFEPVFSTLQTEDPSKDNGHDKSSEGVRSNSPPTADTDDDIFVESFDLNAFRARIQVVKAQVYSVGERLQALKAREEELLKPETCPIKLARKHTAKLLKARIRRRQYYKTLNNVATRRSILSLTSAFCELGESGISLNGIHQLIREYALQNNLKKINWQDIFTIIKMSDSTLYSLSLITYAQRHSPENLPSVSLDVICLFHSLHEANVNAELIAYKAAARAGKQTFTKRSVVTGVSMEYMEALIENEVGRIREQGWEAEASREVDGDGGMHFVVEVERRGVAFHAMVNKIDVVGRSEDAGVPLNHMPHHIYTNTAHTPPNAHQVYTSPVHAPPNVANSRPASVLSNYMPFLPHTVPGNPPQS